MKQLFLFAAITLIYSSISFAQNDTLVQKQLEAKRTHKPVIIDGLLNDEAWKDASVATNFIEFKPKAGAPEDTASKTITYLMYGDEGIYFGGYCYERNRENISTELIGRDGFGNNDLIGIIFDTYKDHLNAFQYLLTPLNEQIDAKRIPNSNSEEDYSWNAVWKSATVIHNDSWSFEIFLPYSAIRFGKRKVQDWGVNIIRQRKKTGQQYAWNPINPNTNGLLTQEGYWTGITDIKPPMRLEFSPYFSSYVNHYPTNESGQKNWTTQVNGGVDIKYGINQAFTLDAMLIPDFGQVKSDNKVLNLSPFDIQFNENRSFFTEGSELFKKGNLFYSRRIGIESKFSNDPSENLGVDEEVKQNPIESKIINATKISGRTKNGLGIGMLNAVTNPRFATIDNKTSGSHRDFEIEPLTNYNVLVLDQTLKYNSSISLVNTNVWRSGPDYDANVTAGLFSFNDKKNKWNFSGKTAVSNRIGFLADGKTQTGYNQQLSFSKTSGRFLFNIGNELANDKYNSSDMGYFTINNYSDYYLWMGYRWREPTKWYNSISLNINAFYEQRLKPTTYANTNFNISVNGQLKNLWFVGGLIEYAPAYNNFYEPRVADRFFRGSAGSTFDIWIETNEAKKYSLSTECIFISKSLFSGRAISLTINQKFRFNNKFSLSHDFSFEPKINDVGFAGKSSADVIFGRRNVQSISNTLSAKYNFNDKMGLTFKARHYVSTVDNKAFFTLLNDGNLTANNTFSKNVNQNTNFFNIDLVYTWQFASGSFVYIVWKNAVVNETDQIEKRYFKNLSNTIKTDANNNLSLKIIYFLDYFNIKKKKPIQYKPLA